MIKVLIISPVQAVRAGLRVMLTGWAPGSTSPAQPGAFEVRESTSLSEAIAADFESHVLVLAIRQQPGSPAMLAQPLDGLIQFVKEHPGKLAVLLLDDNPGIARSIVGLPWRAWGALPLETTQEELAAAITALNHGLWVSSPALPYPDLLRFPALNDYSIVSPELEELIEPLTGRELEVLQLMALGLANKQIAARLNISEHTVKYHVSAILSRLSVGSRTEAVRAGFQRGLVSL